MPCDETKNRRDISKEMRDGFHLKGLRRLTELGLKSHHKLDTLRVINDYDHCAATLYDCRADIFIAAITILTIVIWWINNSIP